MTFRKTNYENNIFGKTINKLKSIIRPEDEAKEEDELEKFLKKTSEEARKWIDKIKKEIEITNIKNQYHRLLNEFSYRGENYNRWKKRDSNSPLEYSIDSNKRLAILSKDLKKINKKYKKMDTEYARLKKEASSNEYSDLRHKQDNEVMKLYNHYQLGTVLSDDEEAINMILLEKKAEKRNVNKLIKLEKNNVNFAKNFIKRRTKYRNRESKFWEDWIKDPAKHKKEWLIFIEDFKKIAKEFYTVENELIEIEKQGLSPLDEKHISKFNRRINIMKDVKDEFKIYEEKIDELFGYYMRENLSKTLSRD